MTEQKSKQEEATSFSLETLRQAFEDRATWFYLLLKEAEGRGYDAEAIAQSAIYKYGVDKGKKMTSTDDLNEFLVQFANPVTREVFAMSVAEMSDDHLVIEFHHCPLVKAWQDRHGATTEETDKFCLWAVQGDYGLMSAFPNIEFTPEKRIGAGDSYCKMVFRKKDK
ncbi:L-2-amino-thiazoline-4-carboxylic acid hydrolase [Heliorestis acidaminivorans]|uniref:L-2-amino-thiazoline-4-carboxylic acid hydrolase n=1 Tax=Heliorestis acidaminivorans TaxID=553427 RepID=A0A6I0EWP9_9FIRM|nr:L-2-amino-thiazoline-4-carboxylic acid hydrolase [Heliorestis acidaminivorans]KAB2954219.1 L-2-amino-thiazoline-4-carboxylic acid hydrolase [Heliorestis acidaminivorans]